MIQVCSVGFTKVEEVTIKRVNCPKSYVKIIWDQCQLNAPQTFKMGSEYLYNSELPS